MSKKTIRDKTSRWLFHAVRLPGILETDEAAARLGVASHAIPILIGAGHLKPLGKKVRKKVVAEEINGAGEAKPLGKPGDRSSKKFSSDYIEGLVHDQAWLDKAVCIIDSYWSAQNLKRKEKDDGVKGNETGDLKNLPKAA